MIAEQPVAIGLVTPPELDATPGEVRLLAGREEGAEVVLSLHGDARGSFLFELEGEEDASRYLDISDPLIEGSTAKFRVTLTGEEIPGWKDVGPSSWQTVYTLHSRASDGKTEIEGPDVKVIILREGLFVEKIFAVDENEPVQDQRQDDRTSYQDRPANRGPETHGPGEAGCNGLERN